MKRKIYIFFVALLGVLSSVDARNYYLTGTSDPTNTNNWTANADGTGTNPSNFKTDGDNFIIPSGFSASMTSTWTFGNAQAPKSVGLDIYGTLTIANNTTTAVALDLRQSGSASTTVNVYSGGSIVFQDPNSNQIIGGGTSNLMTVNFLQGSTIQTLNATGVTGNATQSIDNSQVTPAFNAAVNYVFSGASQTLGLPTTITQVNNLTFSGSGTKTLYAELSTISGVFTLSGTASTTAVAAMTFAGNVDIGTGTTFNDGGFTHTVAGSWTKSGTYTASGTLNFNGSTSQTINSSNFKNIQFSGSGTKSLSGTLTVTGNWNNQGTLSVGTSTVSFTSTAAQTIAETGTGGFYNLTLNGTGLKSLGSNLSVSNQLTLTSGLLDISTYNLTVASFSGGSSSSYIKTSSTGKLKQTLNLNASKNFPVGNSAYNPIEITNNQESPSGEFNVRVSDVAITNSNDPTKGVNRRWYVTKTTAGDVNITAKMTYNSGEQGANFNAASNPKMALFNGTFWTYTTATVSGTQFTATGILTDSSTYPDQYLTIGSDNAFNASKFAVSMDPVNPTLGVANTVITVRTLNSNNVETCVSQATGFSVTATNTTTSPSSLTGTIAVNTHETMIESVAFTTASYNAYLTVASTSGENLTTTNSANFSVLAGDIYEPTNSGNFNSSTWRKSTDGGATWSSVTMPVNGNVFGTTDLIRIPAGITTTLNTNVSMYSMIVFGTIDLTSGATLTLNHQTVDDTGFDLHIHGTFKNSGGDFVNNDGTNGTTHPIEIHSGLYWHARNGGSIPNTMWVAMDGVNPICKVTGITTTALTSGLDQNFITFEWNNASQTVTQTISGDMHVSGELILTNGVITTGSNYLIEASAGTVSRTNGWINGNFRYYVPNTTNANVFFPIGDVNYYTPVSVTFNGTTSGSGYVNARTDVEAPPAASGLSQTKYVNRKWTVVSSGVNFSSYSISLSYNANDLIGSPTVGNFVMRRVSNNTWYNCGGSLSGNTFTASNQTTFSDFYIAEADCSSRYVWFGSTSSDWNTGSNWCSGSVPDRTVDVYIPGGIATYPTVANYASCKNIELTSGASLNTSSGSLYVYGNITNAGTVVCGDTLGMIGSANQTISGAGSISLNHFQITNTGGVSSSSAITVDGQLNLGTANQSATAGCLDMTSSSVLTMGANSTTTGANDVSGIIRRAHTFNTNTNYSFGNQYTTVNFAGTGTQPSWIECKVQIGTSPVVSNAVKRRYYFKVNASGYSDFVTVKVHYLNSELNGNYASKLVYFDDHNGAVQHEHGYSDRDTVNNWISLSGKSISYLATTSGSKYYFLNKSALTKNNWLGVTNTWNDAANWSAGHAPNNSSYIADALYIPAGKSRYPVINANITFNSIEIADGASFSCGANDTIIIKGATNAWHDGTGGFDYATGTVLFDNESSDSIVQISGTTNFQNLVIGETTYIRPKANAVIYIHNNLILNTGAKLDLVTNPNTIVYHTDANVSLVNPTDGVNTGYHHLTLNNSAGIVTFPATMHVKGNLTITGDINSNNGTVVMNGSSEQILGGLSPYVLKNLQIDNAAGVRVDAGDSISVSGDLTINSGKKLTVNAGSQIAVNNMVNNAGASGLVLESASGQPNASLIFNNQVSSPVQATVQLYSKAYASNENAGVFSNYNWQYIGVPVEGLAKSNTNFNGSYLAQFNDATTNGWEVVPSSLSIFKGYSITQPVAKTMEWTGSLINQSQTLQIPSHYVSDSQTPSGGFYLLANSFTSAVEIRDIVFGTSGTDYVVPTVYLFNTGQNAVSSTGSDDTPGQYWSIPQNQAGLNGLPNSISSLQGFFVQAGTTSTSAFVTLPYSSTIVNNGPMKVKAAREQNDIEIAVELKSQNSSDKVWLFRNSSTSASFDAGWDGVKLPASETQASLSVAGQDNEYQVYSSNSLNNTGINFTSGTDSIYSISFKFDYNQLNEVVPQGVFLVDTYTGSRIQLIDDYTKYTFKTAKNAPLQRFKIEFAESVPTEIKMIENTNPVKISVQNSELSLQNNSLSPCDYRLLDLSGRILTTGICAPNSTEMVYHSENQQLIIVQIKNSNLTTSSKIFLR